LIRDVKETDFCRHWSTDVTVILEQASEK